MQIGSYNDEGFAIHDPFQSLQWHVNKEIHVQQGRQSANPLITERQAAD